MSALIQSDLTAATMELRRIRMALGWEPGDGPPPDPVGVIQMLQSWEVDATRRAELMEQHLRAVLEVARTWQPDYATTMDRDTLQYAEDFADRKTPNAEVSGCLRAPMPEDAPRTAAGSPLDRPVGPVAGA